MGLTFERSAYYLSMSSVDFETPGEYLELERKSETRNEYIAGRIFAMSGASLRHSLIAGNLFGLLWTQMRGRGCEAFAVAMRVKVSQTGMYAYPDVVIVWWRAAFGRRALRHASQPENDAQS